MPTYLSPEENARRFALWRQGYTDEQIAEALGCTRGAIVKWRNIRNLPPNTLVARLNECRAGNHDWGFEVGQKVKVTMDNGHDKFGRRMIREYGDIISIQPNFIVVKLPKYKVTIHRWEIKERKVVVEAR